MGDSTQRDHSRRYYTTRRWDPGPSRDESVEECSPYFQLRKTAEWQGNEEDVWGFLLQASPESGPSWLVEQVKAFCEDERLENSEEELNRRIRRRVAWIDDRSFSGNAGAFREYRNPLTAASLQEQLGVPRFSVITTDPRSDNWNLSMLFNRIVGMNDRLRRLSTNSIQREQSGYQAVEAEIESQHVPDADRRLIYIENLDSLYIRALLDTASGQQILVLRDAIAEHIAFRTSIKAIIVPLHSQSGRMFRLELHLPYYALLEERPSKAMKSTILPRWTDLSFLRTETAGSQHRKTYDIMHSAHFSLVIHGQNNARWLAYSFENKHFDERFEDDVQYDCYSYDGPMIHEDPIVSDGTVDANLPIWDPREYFLRVFKARMSQIVRYWELLVWYIEPIIICYRSQHSLNASRTQGSRHAPNEDAQKLRDRIQEARSLLKHLLNVLSSTIEQWEKFTAYNGGIGLFVDFASCSSGYQSRVRGLLGEIEGSFESLQNQKQRLDLLQTPAKEAAEDLKLRLNLENNRATQQYGRISEYMNTVIYPLGLTAALFSMPQWQSVFHFQLSRTSFVITFVVIMILTKLLFLGFGYLSHWWKGRWRKHTSSFTKPFSRDAVTYCFSTGVEMARSLTRKRSRFPSDMEAAVSEC